MTVRARSRHRATVRPSTPLTSLSNAVTDHVGTIGRSGVVLAMSSGLVATMGLPAQASTSGTDAAPATAPLAVQPAVALQSGLITAAGSAQTASAELTAPAAARVKFAGAAFKAVKPKPVTRAAAGANAGGTQYETGAFGNAKGSSIVAVAARYIGVQYVYGGSTPSPGWDCSGATGYIYGQVGISIPRTANQQMLASTRISRSAAVPGALGFFTSGGSAYHVGIYAGGNMMYDAGHTGVTFTKRAIYSSAVVFGRF